MVRIKNLKYSSHTLKKKRMHMYISELMRKNIDPLNIYT